MTEPKSSSTKQHLAGGGPWRWVFESMRVAMEPASLVPNFLLFVPKILHCCTELPPLEVTTDIVLLVQAVSDKWPTIDNVEAARIWRSTCIFVRNICERVQLEFDGNLQIVILHFLQRTITASQTVIILGGDCGVEGVKARMEAIAALGRFLLQLHNSRLLCMDDVTGHILYLTGLTKYPTTPVPVRETTSTSDRADQGCSENKYEMEVQRLLFAAIGSLICQARFLVSNEAWNLTLQTVRVILESVASKNVLVADYVASRYYVDLLRFVYIVVSEPDLTLREHVEAFVKGLRMFFSYNLSLSQDTSFSSSPWQKEKDLGAHLDAHGLEKPQTQVRGDSLCRFDEPESLKTFSFDTFESGSNIPDEDVFRDNSSELRLYSVLDIQAMAQGDLEGVRACSALLLLADSTVQTRSDQATLLTVLLADPIAKVRAAAASTIDVILEMSMYSRRQLEGHCGPLAREEPSDSQKRMFIELQTGLVQVLINERHIGTLLAALKALSIYITKAPFWQLPGTSLSIIVGSISKRLRETDTYNDQSSVKVAGIACLKAALSIVPPIHLEAVLSEAARSGSSSSRQPRSLLFDLISFAQPSAARAVQVEAILALQAAAHNYPGAVATCWNEIFKLVTQVIAFGVEIRSGSIRETDLNSSSFAENDLSFELEQSFQPSNEEFVHAAIELLSQLLRVSSDLEATREEDFDDSSFQSASLQRSPSAESLQLPHSLNFTNHDNLTTSASISLERNGEGCLRWVSALEHIFPTLLQHRSPKVREEALSCFSGLTPAIFRSLPATKQEFILSAIMNASQDDQAPAVRAAAHRVVGVIVAFPQVSKRYKRSSFY